VWAFLGSEDCVKGEGVRASKPLLLEDEDKNIVQLRGKA
jgi:hypothetical protein